MQSIWNIIAVPLGFVMRWCYLLVNDVLRLPVSYIFALFLFTLATKILMFPMSLKQQRSQATMAVYQPLINEINQKYAKDPEKRQKEMEKFQKEYGYNPMSGCLPLLIQLPLIMGLVEVVYKPLSYMLRIPKEMLAVLSEKVTEIVTSSGGQIAERYIENNIIEQIKTNRGAFSGLDIASTGVSAADFNGYIDQIANLNMTIGRVNLWEKPTLAFNWGILIPLFSIATIVLSSLIQTWATRGKQTEDKQQKSTGRIMMLSSTVMFGFMSFTLPAAFSLYWGFSNMVAIAQSFILKKIVNADTIKAEAEARIEEQRRKAKESKKVTVKKKDGEVEEKEMASDELARYRLQRARELDEKRYIQQSEEDE